MEEKERYITLSDRQIKDTYNNSQDFMSIKNVCKILNQQDKRIKELEGKILIQLNNNADNVNFMENQRRENQQLKQQLHDLPNKIVEEISKELKSLYKNYPIIYTEDKDIVKSCYDKDSVNKILDTILKKYGVENE